MNKPWSYHKNVNLQTGESWFSINGPIATSTKEEHDARLIAAVPDLLDAATQALWQFDLMEKMFRDDEEFQTAYNALKEAIKKATGGKL